MRVSQILEGYIYLGSVEMLGNEVSTAYTAVLDSCLRNSLRAIISEHHDVEEKCNTYSTPQEMIKLIPEPHFCACMRKASFFPSIR